MVGASETMIKVRLKPEYTGRQPPAYVYSAMKVRRKLFPVHSVKYRIDFRRKLCGFMSKKKPLGSPRFRKPKRKLRRGLVSPRFVQKKAMRCLCIMCQQERDYKAACPYDFSPKIRLDYEYTRTSNLTFYDDTDFMMFVMIAPADSWSLLYV